jgi:hypothetical protein
MADPGYRPHPLRLAFTNGILASVAQWWGEQVSVSAGGAGASDPAAGGEGGSNPITVDPGKGWWVALPVPREVLGKLGGSGQLEERLRPISDTGLDQFGQLTPDATDELTSAYDGLFRQLKALPAGSGEAGGSEDVTGSQDVATPADPANPIKVNPHGGWSITLPVPEEVLGRLGGSSQVRERLGGILAAMPGPGSDLAPDASDKLSAVYGTLFQHLEAVIREEGRG